MKDAKDPNQKRDESYATALTNSTNSWFFETTKGQKK